MRRFVVIAVLFLVGLTGCSEVDPTTPITPISGEMVLISAGSFNMGAPEDEPGFLGEEALHPVTLTNDFHIYSTEVTNQEYVELARWALEQGHCTLTETGIFDNLDGSELELLDMNEGQECDISVANGELVIEEGLENHPVKEIYWFGAAAFCDWLSLKEGLPRAYNHQDPTDWKCNDGDPYTAQGYRLPTEAEWEYACRAGSSTAFAGGDIVQLSCGDEPALSTMGWFCGNQQGWTSPVASKNPNAFGLYDMHGNLWEWCNDWYRNTYTDEIVDPVGPSPGWYKTLRGGGWSDLSRRCRSASRRNPSPHLGHNGRHGFRYVKSAL